MFGVFVPWYKGFGFFLDPVTILMYSCMALLFVAPASAEAFPSDHQAEDAAILRSSRTTESPGPEGAPAKSAGFLFRLAPQPAAGALLRKAAAVLGYGWGLAVLILVAGIITVNFSAWHGSMLVPSAELLAPVLLLSLTASLVVIGACALLSRYFSAGVLKGIMRLAFLVVLLTVAFGKRLLPERTQEALAEQMTTQGIEQGALISSAVLAGVGALLFVWALRPRHTPGRH